MSNVEPSSSSSTIILTSVENGSEANVSSSTHVADSGASAKLAIGLVIGYIDDVLSAISSKKSTKLVDSGMKLNDMVEPLASDFSKLCEGISQGAKMFSDQKFITSSLSGEAHTMAVDVLKGVGNAHWAAVGLLAIANVLERLDKISSNDRECIDLLKGMLDLAKFIKMMKEIDAHFHKEILEKMSEALHLIVSGAILCHSFIRCNKISKLLSTKKICEELVYLRGKIDRMKVDMVLQMNYMFVSSCTFHLSRNQHITADGGIDQGHANDTGEIYETKIHTTTETVCLETQSPDSGIPDISDNKNGFHLGARLARTFIAFREYLKYTANGLRRIAGQRFDQCRKPVHTLSMNQTPSHLTDDSPPLTIEHGFTFNELMKATDSFDPSNILGEGGFGIIFTGKLTDGRCVVIKISRGVKNVLQRELDCIINLEHPNILTLVGSCIHENELLLVYDFMPEGNLGSLLFGRHRLLDWPTREKIIDGILRALVYLHAEACIVHRDIKPSNILLDENFNAKVSDFGIARKLPKGKSDKAEEEGVFVDLEEEAVETHHSTGVAGTLGYVAPECGMTGHITRKADIYSFGLLLLNIVSGERCFKLTSIKSGMKSLISLAWKLHKQNHLKELIDPRLLNMEDLNSKKIIRTIKVALWCIQWNPQKRPTASRVLEMISSNESIPRPPEQRF